MALVHDVAESLVGDITPHDGVSPEVKQRMESEAIAEIKQMLGEDTYAGKRQKEETNSIWVLLALLIFDSCQRSAIVLVS